MDLTSEFQKMREEAENYYMAGDFYCSETVLKVPRGVKVTVSESMCYRLKEIRLKKKLTN
jgi:hypothetical protein